MYDFLTVKKEFVAKQQRYVYSPSFVLKPKIKDLMTRARDFYAIFNPETNFWVTDEGEAIEMIDKQVQDHVVKDVGEQIFNDSEHGPIIKRIADTDTHLIDKWHKFCQKDMRDRYEKINQHVKFSNSEIKRTDYATYVLPYPLQEQSTPYYDKLVNTLYLPDEKKKFEYLVGCILAGDQSKIQKLFVFYGLPGSGKSTIISKVIANTIFGGLKDAPYCTKFTAGLLAGKNDFGTDFLSSDPVLAFDDDADLSRIEDNTTLNLIVSHEAVRVNAKFKSPFTTFPNCILVCGTNEPVQMSPNSGLNRRLIDIRQTGERLDPDEYDDCMEHMNFEKSGIAYHCLQVYKECGKNYYNKYQPEDMLTMTSPFHNFVKDNYFELKNGVTLPNAYKLYESYCAECNFKTIMTRYKFRDNLKLYFDSYEDQLDDDGQIKAKNFFSGFKSEKIGIKPKEEVKVEQPESPKVSWLQFEEQHSLFDDVFKDAPAQYEIHDEENNVSRPQYKWETCKTKLSDLDTSKTHYTKIPKEFIVIDLDRKGEDGKKSFEKNYEAAIQFPPTYAELSKSGEGIHLHYIFTGGNPEELSRVCGDNVEVKVFTGNASLRRKLTKCNNLPIAELASGLPFKEKKGGSMIDVNDEWYKNLKASFSAICNALEKKHHGHTRPEINYIHKILTDLYRSGVSYDFRELQPKVFAFAVQSSNSKSYCTNLVAQMHFCSDDNDETNLMTQEYLKQPIVIFDVESYPEDENNEGLFILCWKFYGKDKTVVKLINPTSKEVEKLFKYRLVGFNNLDYDNNMLWAAAHGYTAGELNRLSQRIISGDKSAKFREARNLSWTDVYDFASAGNKKGLKKWEIELKIHHKEMSIPWDKPAPKNRWDEIAEYCANDVLATEAVFDHLVSDYEARLVLAELSGLTPNDTTNSHTIAILTNGIKDPQKNYIYTDLSKIYPGYEFNEYGIDHSRYKEGVKIVAGKSIYKGIDPGEGGRKIGYRGMYFKVGLFDVASMHPSSIRRLNLFGDEITKKFGNLVDGRLALKHLFNEDGTVSQANYDRVIELLGESVRKYLPLDNLDELERSSSNLATALKTAINSVYGLTAASFDNKLRDPRNKDNIVAKYGALFMINLEEEITKLGYTVVHISTDSIKVADVDDKIAKFIMDYGKEYGFTFEYEALYSRMCLVNDAVYIARFATADECKRLIGFVPGDNFKAEKKKKYWTATGKQFAVPYVYKTLFSHEEILTDDLCDTFNTTKGALYLDMNESLPDVSELESEYEKYKKFIDKYSDVDIYEDTKLRNKYEKFLLYFKNEVGADPNQILTKVPEAISKGHNYTFIGRTSSFMPIMKGCGGGILYRYDNNKYSAAAGTTGFRWLETENVLNEAKEQQIDRTYFTKLVDDAVDAIAQYGDFEYFIGDAIPPSKEFMNPPTVA